MKKGTPDVIDVKVGQNLKRLRKIRGFSQTDLANATGVTFQQVQKYERGTNRISASRMYQLSRVLGYPIQAFFDGITDEMEGQEIPYIPKRYLKFFHKLKKINDPNVEKAIFALVETYSDRSESD